MIELAVGEGSKLVDAASDMALAKEVRDEDKRTYFIRCSTESSSRNNFYNPYGQNKADALTKFNASKGKRLFEFRKVKEEVFDFYTKFLRTKNETYLTQAQRLNKDAGL